MYMKKAAGPLAALAHVLKIRGNAIMVRNILLRVMLYLNQK